MQQAVRPAVVAFFIPFLRSLYAHLGGIVGVKGWTEQSARYCIPAHERSASFSGRVPVVHRERLRRGADAMRCSAVFWGVEVWTNDPTISVFCIQRMCSKKFSGTGSLLTPVPERIVQISLAKLWFSAIYIAQYHIGTFSKPLVMYITIVNIAVF